MKRFMMSMLVMILCISMPLVTFAQSIEESEDEDDFHIVIDATDTSEQIYQIDGIEFKVLPVLTKATVPANRTVIVRDILNDAILGNVYIYADCIYDGQRVSAVSYFSRVMYKPSSSDLRVTNTTLEGNGTRMLTVTSKVAFTGSTGKKSSGGFELRVYSNGYYQ
ncbi:hypothetical protein CD30_19365 [Ureibacillus massiliensis 4400831 = CIP 108448 = CCUG 49529]|uniref:Uncharacterized protein n=2 Tax=Ureibacillus massiliensis TaxID=292806 RepID=A0A0A3IGY7_9BACL|nr:hypothetical protein CD30_19365 [Ureibacillus massiliensis 4400831 = CIP 108448 = CCUG 49529]